MHPVTDPSMQGMGNTPTFLLEGSWVIGFFRDAEEKQQPIIMGSLPGVPTSTPDSSKGFNDPNANYPSSSITHSTHSTGESDTNRLARGGEDAETHQSLIDRRDFKLRSVTNANKPNFGPDGVSTKLVSEDERTTWAEPDPQGAATSASQYPYNHVFESESGHISEIDDTPGAERLHREHRTGTFEEIHPDGSRVTKIVGDDYEMFLKGKNVVVDGNMNLTVRGDVRLMVEKNLYQEVRGDYHLRVDGDMVTKIRGNEQKEIQSSKSTQINENRSLRIGGNEDSTIDGSTREKFKGDMYQVYSNNVTMTIKGFERHLITDGSFTMYTSGNTNIMTDSNFTVKTTSNVNIHTEDNLNMDATSNVTIDTPAQFLVGTSTTPTNTFIKSTRIDLND